MNLADMIEIGILGEILTHKVKPHTFNNPDGIAGRCAAFHCDRTRQGDEKRGIEVFNGVIDEIASYYDVDSAIIDNSIVVRLATDDDGEYLAASMICDGSDDLYCAEYEDWRELANMRIFATTEVADNFHPEQIIAEVVYEMTWNGWSNAEVQASGKELSAVLGRAINELNKDTK